MRSTRTTAEVSALVEDNLSLVHHVVFQVAVQFPRHVERAELVNAGVIGLLEAARRYDGTRGVPFKHFASRRIRGAIIDGVRAADWAPRSVRRLARRLDVVEQQLAGRLGRPPNLAETAREMDMDPEALHALRDSIFRSVVLAFEHVVTDVGEDELTLVDVLADDAREPGAEMENRELKAYLRQAVVHLPERHRLVVVGYFVEDRSSEDLARFLGVTESRISQMRTEALAMMRSGIEAQYAVSDTAAPDTEPSGEPVGLVGRRRAAYARRIGEGTTLEDRLGERDDPDSPEGFAAEIERLLGTAPA